MALDESKDTDLSYEFGGFTYIVDKTLMAQVQPISIDFSPMGFRIASNLQSTGGCSGCSSGSSCSC